LDELVVPWCENEGVAIIEMQVFCQLRLVK
jgi:hypothetical protein